MSIDGGATWSRATLGEDLGKYSFREWTARVTLPPGKREIKVRATNRAGQSQPMEPLWNPSGYMRNVVETTTVRSFHHYTVGGELTIEEPEVISRVVDSVSCRWCGHGRGVEVVAEEA